MPTALCDPLSSGGRALQQVPEPAPLGLLVVLQQALGGQRDHEPTAGALRDELHLPGARRNQGNTYEDCKEEPTKQLLDPCENVMKTYEQPIEAL